MQQSTRMTTTSIGIIKVLYLIVLMFVMLYSNVSSFIIIIPSTTHIATVLTITTTSSSNYVSLINEHFTGSRNCRIPLYMARAGGAGGAGSVVTSLKPISSPLMDSGKTLARAGELIIDITSELDIYGSSFSTAGAQIRNAGDSIAQAAASCRFKTGTELVINELREAATCLAESSLLFIKASKEVITSTKTSTSTNTIDTNTQLVQTLELAGQLVNDCSVLLEASGEGIMKRMPFSDIGSLLVSASDTIRQLSELIPLTVTSIPNNTIAQTMATESSVLLISSADTMQIAGNQLMGNNVVVVAKEIPKQ